MKYIAILFVALFSSIAFAATCSNPDGNLFENRCIGGIFNICDNGGWINTQSSSFCNDNVLNTCSGEVMQTTNCAASGQICKNGACVVPTVCYNGGHEYQPGSKICTDTTHIATCTAGTWVNEQTCTSGCKQGDAVCKPIPKVDLTNPTVAVLKTDFPRTVALRYQSGYGNADCGKTFTSTYSNSDWNIKSWSISADSGFTCSVSSSSATEATFSCVVNDSACNSGNIFTKPYFVQLNAIFKTNTCIKQTIGTSSIWSEGYSYCDSGKVVTCMGDNVFAVKEDCSATPNTVCKDTGGYPPNAYCQTTCTWNGAAGTIKKPAGSTACLYNGVIQSTEAGVSLATAISGVTDSGIYVCSDYSGAFERVLPISCWVQTPTVVFPDKYRVGGTTFSGEIDVYGSFFAPGPFTNYTSPGLDTYFVTHISKKAGLIDSGCSEEGSSVICTSVISCSSGMCTKKVRYSFWARPSEVAPKPPNPHPIIHASWYAPGWNIFISWIVSVFNQ